MTDRDRNLILQAAAFAQVFLKEADRASAGQSSATHEAAAQLRAALSNLPPAIEGCSCDCIEFNQIKHDFGAKQFEPETGCSPIPAEVDRIDLYKQTPDGLKLVGSAAPQAGKTFIDIIEEIL